MSFPETGDSQHDIKTEEGEQDTEQKSPELAWHWPVLLRQHLKWQRLERAGIRTFPGSCMPAQSWGKMQGAGKRCRDLGKDAGSWDKMQRAGIRCRKLGKDAETWEKMQRVGERCRELGKDAESWEKM